MAKPQITFRSDTDPYPLTYTELDTNFLNLRDATINFTGDAGDTRSMDLNDATAINGERNIKITVDEATQTIKVRNTLSDYTTDPNGFENRTDSTISFNSSTRVFTIAPTATDYEIWNQGQQYTVSTSKTVTIPNTTGIYFVYFDGSTLSYVLGAEPNWPTQTPVSYVFWNATTSASLFTDERHGIRMDASTKEYLHETAAMAYAEGFLASNYTTAGDGSLDAHAQLDLDNGVCYDQDIRVEITHSNTPTANTWQQDLQGPARIPVVYHSGATGAWTVDAQRDYPLKNGTSLVTYNLNTAGTWTTPDCTSTYYVAYWIVATNFLNTPIIAVMGQRQDNKLSDAIANNTWGSLDLSNFPAEEFRPLYRILVRTASGYANTPKAYFAQVDDFRQSAITPAGSIVAVNAFTTISVAGQTDITADTATDALTLVAGTGITLTTDPTTDSVTITNSSVAPNTFGTIAVSGQSNVVADSSTDTLTLVGSGITITTNASTDTITFTSTASGVVNSGLANRLAFYPSAGTSVDDTLIDYTTATGLQTLNSTGNFELIAGSSGNSQVRLKGTAVRVDRETGSALDARITTAGAFSLTLDTNSGTSTASIQIQTGVNGNIVLAPAGTGDVQANADTLRVGDQNANATITTWGTGDLILNTNSGTNDSGTITIADGINGDITLDPTGSGRVIVDNTTLYFNASTSRSTIRSSGRLTLECADGGNAYIEIGDQDSDNDIALIPGTAGTVNIHSAVTNLGPSTTGGNVDLRLQAANNLRLTAWSGGLVNGASITLQNATDADIILTPNGNGDVIIDGEVQINATTTLTPTNTSTPVAWMEIGANGNTYYIPLYQ